MEDAFQEIGVKDFKVRRFFLIFNESPEVTVMASESSKVH
jgi:hypothetical protein